jgi:plastocyanin
VARTLLLTALALLLCGAGAGATQKARKPATHTVTLDATSFQPASLAIRAGDSVTWVNKDVMPHTATSTKAGVFDSGTLAPGKSWKYTFKTAGDIAYVCQFHPTMKGAVQVKK